MGLRLCGVCRRGQERVRLCPSDVLYRRFDIREFLSFVTPHEEHSGLNASRLAQLHCRLHLLDGHASLHRVQHPLRAAFRPDPDAKAAEIREMLHRRHAMSFAAVADLTLGLGDVDVKPTLQAPRFVHYFFQVRSAAEVGRVRRQRDRDAAFGFAVPIVVQLDGGA